MIDLILSISLAQKQMCVVEMPTQNEVVCYPIAVGKNVTPTPAGKFQIQSVVVDPQFVSCDTGVNHGAGFLGKLAIVTDKQTSPGCSFAIHGTNNESLIGQEVSAGCVRMTNRDISHLELNFLPYIQKGIVR